MKLKLTTMTALAATAALALPATAPAKAHSPASAKTVVTKRIKAADAALVALRRAARHHDATAATAALRASRRSTAFASVLAQQVAASNVDPLEAAKLLKLVGGQELQNFDAYAGLIHQVSVALQAALAQGANNAAIGRQAIIEKLTALLPTLPAEAQGALAAVIASLGSGGSGGLTQITSLLQGGTVPPEVQSLLTTVLQTVHANVTEILNMVQQQLGTLNPQAAAIAGPILAMVTKQMESVFAIIGNVLGGGLTTGSIGTTGTTGTTGSTGSTGTTGSTGPGGLFQLPGLGFLQGLLPNLPGFNLLGGFGGLGSLFGGAH